jgi:hypothetical protein
VNTVLKNSLNVPKENRTVSQEVETVNYSHDYNGDGAKPRVVESKHTPNKAQEAHSKGLEK